MDQNESSDFERILLQERRVRDWMHSHWQQQQNLKQEQRQRQQRMQQPLQQQTLRQQQVRQQPLQQQKLRQQQLRQQQLQQQQLRQHQVQQQQLRQNELRQQQSRQQQLRKEPFIQQPLRQQPLKHQKIDFERERLILQVRQEERTKYKQQQQIEKQQIAAHEITIARLSGELTDAQQTISDQKSRIDQQVVEIERLQLLSEKNSKEVAFDQEGTLWLPE